MTCLKHNLESQASSNFKKNEQERTYAASCS